MGYGGGIATRLLVVRIRYMVLAPPSAPDKFIVNCVVNYEDTFNKSSAGWYILPEFDEENGTNSALRSLLKVFIEASWGTCTLRIVP